MRFRERVALNTAVSTSGSTRRSTHIHRLVRALDFMPRVPQVLAARQSTIMIAQVRQRISHPIVRRLRQSALILAAQQLILDGGQKFLLKRQDCRYPSGYIIADRLKDAPRNPESVRSKSLINSQIFNANTLASGAGACLICLRVAWTASLCTALSHRESLSPIL